MPKRFSYLGKMQLLRDARGGRCECGCGRTEGLEFAHRRPTEVYGRGRGLPQRYHDIKRHPDAYVLLAPGCHKQQELREMAAERIARGEVMQMREPGDDSGEEDE